LVRCILNCADNLQGSGCVAALEAEKWLLEQEDAGEEPEAQTNPLEKEKHAEKSQINNIVPEYRSNPQL
jgi:thioredoxin reductase (NADPH)